MPRLTRAASANAEIKVSHESLDGSSGVTADLDPNSARMEKMRGIKPGENTLRENPEKDEIAAELEDHGSQPGSEAPLARDLNLKNDSQGSLKSTEQLRKPSSSVAPKTPGDDSKLNASRKSSDPTYIPPLERHLGIYNADLLPPEPMLNSTNVIDFELRKLVGLVVHSTGKSFTGEFLQGTTTLAAQFMKTFASTLRKLTDLQRHKLAGVADLELCLDSLGISANDLYEENIRCQSLSSNVRQQAVRLNSEVERVLHDYHAEKYVLEKDDPSYVFYTNEQYEIAALIPQQTRSRDYIPEYFPELPPDFTYRLTSSFMDTMTELKKIKMKLFEESRLNEASLYKLIDDDEKRWLEELDEQLGSISDGESDDQRSEIMSVSGGHISDVESPLPDHVEVNNKQPTNGVHNYKIELKKKDEETSAASVTPFEALVKLVDSDINVADNPAKSEDDLIESDLLELAEPSKSENPSLKLSLGLKYQVSHDLPSSNNFGATKTHGENRFDLVAYAQQKRLALERPVKELELQRQRRKQNYYLQAETMFSCYATKTPTQDEIRHFDQILDNSFKNVIRATRRAERDKKKKLARMEEERKRLQNEQEKVLGTLKFAFNEETNFLDDSDDDNAPLFEFGDFGDNHTQHAEAHLNTAKFMNEKSESGFRELIGDLPIPSVLEAQPGQVSEKSLMTASLCQVVEMEVDAVNEDDTNTYNFDEGIDGMLEELELLPAATWEAKPAESESEEDELEDF